MKLTDVKRDYIIRFRHRLMDRAFIIDTMAQVSDRPIVLVDKSDIHTSMSHTLEIGAYSAERLPSEIDELMIDTNNAINFNNSTDVAEEAYDPPPKDIPGEVSDDQVQTWRASTGIDMVHKQETPYELIRNYNNWLLMPPDKKKESDKMCMKFFYYTNEDYFKVLLKAFIDDDKLQLGDIVDLVIRDGQKTCRCFLDKIVGDILPTSLVFKYLDNGEGRPFGETDIFTISKGDIENLKESKVMTTVGRYLLNYMLLVNPFGDFVPYFNDKWDSKVIEKQIAAAVMADKLTVDQLKSYENNLFFIGHFSELCVPTHSRKSLGTDPNIAKLKHALFEKYKGRLTDPLVIAEIENALIAADKKHLDGDSSMRFYGALGSKAFNVARKKMYLTVGGIETFSKASGKYTFLPNSLSEGWEKEYIPTIANEIRKGSYSRGFETQLGGVQTKLITRVFQDLSVYTPDCGTMKGLKVDFNRFSPKEYLGRWVLNKGTWILITEDNIKDLLKGEQVIRSPMYCEAPKGLCYKCVGEIFRKLSVKQLAAIEIDISSTFLTLSMKNMHGTKLELLELKDLDQFITE